MAELRYNSRGVPFGPLVAAAVCGFKLEPKEDPVLKASAPPVLTLPSKCVPCRLHPMRIVSVATAAVALFLV
jgi:hypothetical protein